MTDKATMHVVCRIGVSFETAGYEQAGAILDAIDAHIGAVLQGRGHHDITSFETRPCKAARFDEAANQHGTENVGMSPGPMRRHREDEG